MARSTRLGFTLTDLTVTLFVLVLLAGGALPPATMHAREGGNNLKCASNLRQIGLAIQMYANTNKGTFPRTIFDGAPNPQPTFYTNPTTANPFKPGGPQPNDVTAALYRLMTEDLTAGVFVCPVDRRATPMTFGGLSQHHFSNFAGRANLSYSYINPYPSRRAMKQGSNSISPSRLTSPSRPT